MSKFSDELVGKVNPDVVEKINGMDKRSRRQAAAIIKGASSYYIGENTRTDMQEFIAQSDGLESGFVLYKSGNDKELRLKEVGTKDRTTNSAVVPSGTQNTVPEGTLGYGHTHTVDGYNVLYKDKPQDISKFNKPTTSPQGLGDYKNVLYGTKDKANVQFIVTPMGYTVYSSTRLTPKNSSHPFPQQILNSGNAYNFSGIYLHNFNK